MMKLLRQCFTLIAILLMINGCTENDLSLLPPQCQLVSIGTDTLTYTNNRWTGGSDAFGKYVVVYGKGDRIQELSYQNSRAITYSYDGEGRITKIVVTVGGIQTNYYFYNSYGQLSTHSIYFAYGYSSGSDSLVSVYKYPNSFSSNYISSVNSEFKKKIPVNDITYTTYEYDDKPNPRRLPIRNNLMLYTINNITKSTSTYSFNSNVDIISNAYTYNSKGYPLTQVTTYSGASGSVTKTFAYANCQ